MAALTNAALALFGLNRRESERWPNFAPPGHTIGLVWIALFAGLGAALWLAPERRTVAVLLALCLAYPFYTHVAGGHAIELAGNGVTFGYAVWLALGLRSRAPAAALLVACVAAWVAFATVLVIALVRLNGWAT